MHGQGHRHRHRVLAVRDVEVGRVDTRGFGGLIDEGRELRLGQRLAQSHRQPIQQQPPRRRRCHHSVSQRIALRIGDNRLGRQCGANGPCFHRLRRPVCHHRRVVDLGQVQRGTLGDRGGAVRDAVAEAHRGVVIGIRGEGPGRRIHLHQRARRGGQAGDAQRVAVHIRRPGQQFGRGDRAAAVLQDRAQIDGRAHGGCVVDRGQVQRRRLRDRGRAVRDAVAEAHRAVVIGIRGEGPGRRIHLHQRARRGGQAGDAQRVAVHIRRPGQQFGRGDRAAAVLQDRAQIDGRAHGGCVVDRGQVQRRRLRDRGRAVRDAVAEAHRAVVIGIRGEGPGRRIHLHQRARRGGQAGDAQRVAVHIRRPGQQFGRGDRAAAVLQDRAQIDGRAHGGCVVRALNRNGQRGGIGQALCVGHLIGEDVRRCFVQHFGTGAQSVAPAAIVREGQGAIGALDRRARGNRGEAAARAFGASPDASDRQRVEHTVAIGIVGQERSGGRLRIAIFDDRGRAGIVARNRGHAEHR